MRNLVRSQLFPQSPPCSKPFTPGRLTSVDTESARCPRSVLTILPIAEPRPKRSEIRRRTWSGSPKKCGDGLLSTPSPSRTLTISVHLGRRPEHRGGGLRLSKPPRRCGHGSGTCERQNWTPPKLAEVVLSPRIYRYEGLPRGPTWHEGRRVVVSTEGEGPMPKRGCH